MTIPQWGFSGPMKPNDETNNPNEQKMVKNPNWQEADVQVPVVRRLVNAIQRINHYPADKC